MGKVFISHSRHDKELVENLKSIIENLGQKTYIYEYEDHPEDEAPNEDIKNAIRNSDFIFVFISENVVSREHTKAWITSEAAIAREAEKSVLLFQPKDLITDMVIPYITDLMIYNKDDIKDFIRIQRIAKDHFQKPSGLKRGAVGTSIGFLLGAPFGPLGLLIGSIGGAVIGYATKPKELDVIQVACPKCKNKYSYYSPMEKRFQCPICKTYLEVNS